jgi:hypothetical protein
MFFNMMKRCKNIGQSPVLSTFLRLFINLVLPHNLFRTNHNDSGRCHWLLLVRFYPSSFALIIHEVLYCILCVAFMLGYMLLKIYKDKHHNIMEC